MGEIIQLGGSGGTPSATNPNYYGGEIPFLGIADIEGRDIAHTAKTLTKEGLRNSAAWIVPAGAVSLAMYASVGKVGIIRQDTATSQAFYNMVFEDVAIRDFVFTRLEKADASFEWEPYISTGTQRNLNADKVKAFAIAVPGSREAAKIGRYFANLDSLITLHQRKRCNGPFTHPLVWEQRKFSEIVDVCSGRDYKHLNEGPIPVYGTGGYMTSVCEALSHNRDAVGIGRKGTIDKPYLLKAPFWTVDTLFYAIPKPVINLEFALCSFLNVDWKSKDESTGLPSLSKEAINETVLRVPNAVEQNHLGSFFTDLDSLITLHQ